MWFHAKKHIQQGHGRTGANSAAVASALCTVHVHVEQTDEHHDMYFKVLTTITKYLKNNYLYSL